MNRQEPLLMKKTEGTFESHNTTFPPLKQPNKQMNGEVINHQIYRQNLIDMASNQA